MALHPHSPIQQNNPSRSVIITGGGTGIGRAAAARFLAQGDRVLLNGRRAEVLRATARELDPSGERIATVAGDIALKATAESLMDTAVERFGGVDVLVNNAGVFAPQPFAEHGVEDFDRYVNIILRGTFHTSQAALKHLQRSRGAIVNVGSMWAEKAVGLTPSSAYTARLTTWQRRSSSWHRPPHPSSRASSCPSTEVFWRADQGPIPRASGAAATPGGWSSRGSPVRRSWATHKGPDRTHLVTPS